MIGTICGDFIGSVFEWHNHKSKEFELFSHRSRFTDDSVMTIATMDALLNDLDFGF
jgi:ADP-ribosylglycohydrolase